MILPESRPDKTYFSVFSRLENRSSWQDLRVYVEASSNCQRCQALPAIILIQKVSFRKDTAI